MDDNKSISARNLQTLMTEKKPVYILDVRPAEQREEWFIPGSTHIDAYKRLNSGDFTVLDELNIPDNAQVVTVCEAGRTSLFAAEALRRKGIQAYSLEGGMKAWNFAWNTAEVTLADDLKVIQLRRSVKGCLSYLIGSETEAIVIDASLDPDVYLQWADKNGWKIRYVMDTHIHADFISRTRDLAKASGAIHLLINKAKVDFAFTPVKDGDLISFGKASLEIMHTPGHTWESTSYKIGDEALFTGDTLFIDGVGRPDLKADENETVQKSKQLHQSLRHLLLLPSSTWVFPAHTSRAVPFDSKLIAETIGKLKIKLDLVKLSEREFVEYTLSKIPPTPPNYLTIAELNKQGSYEGHQPSELEAGANRCAIG